MKTGRCTQAPDSAFHVFALIECPLPPQKRQLDRATRAPANTVAITLRQVCSAARIGWNWALTARHCLEYKGRPREAQNLAIAIEFNLGDEAVLSIMPITALARGADDIALLQFDAAKAPRYARIEKSGTQAEIFDSALMAREFDESVVKAQVWGYGATKTEATVSGLLDSLIVATVPIEAASNLPAKERDRIFRIKEQSSNAPKLCGGDSGGPMFLRETVLTAVSIVSPANCDEDDGNKADFLRVSPFCPWIEKTTCSVGSPVCCIKPWRPESENGGGDACGC